MEKKFIQSFFRRIAILLFLLGLIVVVLDPLFHYHKPWFALKAVLTDKEYQCIGTLRTFDYESLIVGSSVAENYYNGWFNEGFDTTTIKAIRSYGATADLTHFLDVAYENHQLKYVFYNMDPASLAADPYPSFEATGCPMYLYNKNILDDVSYLFNKSVLMEKIPYMIANSFIGDYDENNSYNWAQWKSFNKEMALDLYMRTPSVFPMKSADYYAKPLAKNITLIESQVSAHPETSYKIFFPPYSILWWDNLYRMGDRDAYIYNMEKTIKTLLAYENVEIYYFQNEYEIITDLDNYMDTLHFSPEINKYMADEIIAGNQILTKNNYKQTLKEMKDFSDKIVNELILPYENLIKIDYTIEQSF